MTDPYAAFETLTFDRPHERVLRVTMNRPERLNAANATMHRELAEIWRVIDADHSVNCAILTGAGKAFSAGGDFEMIEEIMDDYKTRVQVWKEARDIVYNVINCSKPIVSAIRGRPLVRDWSQVSFRMFRLPRKRPGSSTDTPGWASRRATMRSLFGRCFAAWRKPNTTCCCAIP